jgi:SHS2 domain-containing protein
MAYEYRGDIAHADVAFDARSETVEGIFTECARATVQVMAEDLSSVQPIETVQIELEQESEEMLLFDFLNELIFYKDARQLLLLPARLAVENIEQGWRLKGTLQGETIDSTRHQLSTDVKAVTMLRFSLAQTAEGWRATVVLDV